MLERGVLGACLTLIGPEHTRGRTGSKKAKTEEKALFLEEQSLKNWRARRDLNLWPSAPETDGYPVSVLPAAWGSASCFLTPWDLFGSPAWPIKTGCSEFSALARTDYESVALPTELRRCTTVPQRTMQQRIVNRTPQTAVMTRVVGSSWTSVPCRLSRECGFISLSAATMGHGGCYRDNWVEPRLSRSPVHATDAGPQDEPRRPGTVSERSAGVLRRVRGHSEKVSGSGSPRLAQSLNSGTRVSRSTTSVEGAPPPRAWILAATATAPAGRSRSVAPSSALPRRR